MRTFCCGLLFSAFVLSAHAQEQDFDKWRIGSYGEVLASFKDYGLNRYYGNSKGNTKKNHNEISIPRFVLSGDYKITSKWVLSAEIEFEAGGTGTTYEIEAQSGSENGEYETEIEKGGEVALEQFHITRCIFPALNVRVGHMILPIGGSASLCACSMWRYCSYWQEPPPLMSPAAMDKCTCEQASSPAAT